MLKTGYDYFVDLPVFELADIIKEVRELGKKQRV